MDENDCVVSIATNAVAAISLVLVDDSDSIKAATFATTVDTALLLLMDIVIYWLGSFFFSD